MRMRMKKRKWFDITLMNVFIDSYLKIVSIRRRDTKTADKQLEEDKQVENERHKEYRYA